MCVNTVFLTKAFTIIIDEMRLQFKLQEDEKMSTKILSVRKHAGDVSSKHLTLIISVK